MKHEHCSGDAVEANAHLKRPQGHEMDNNAIKAIQSNLVCARTYWIVSSRRGVLAEASQPISDQYWFKVELLVLSLHDTACVLTTLDVI
ncbi:hypothetical protein ACTXT7_008210 [Hymenolepis weldensis]